MKRYPEDIPRLVGQGLFTSDPDGRNVLETGHMIIIQDPRCSI